MKTHEKIKYVHWLVLIVGLCVTLLAWYAVRQDSAYSLQQEFELRVAQIGNRLEKRVQDGRTILRTTAGLYNASEEVTRDEFKAFIAAHDFANNYPGIQGVGVAWLLSAKNKSQFLQQLRKHGTVDYDIWPTGEREWYAPTIFLEPANEASNNALGFDMYSEPLRRAAMEKARDSGASAVTDLVRMVTSGKDIAKMGFLAVAPIYRHGAPHGTLETRRANIVGWVYLPFLIDEVIPGVMSDEVGNELRNTIAFHIYFGDPTAQNSQVYQSTPANTPLNDYHKPLFKATRKIELSGKTFTVEMHSTAAFEARMNDAKSNIVLIGGMLGSMLLSLLAWVLVTARSRAVKIAAEMSREMVEREKRYRQMFEDNASISYVIDPDNGKIIDANAAAANFWGYAVEELRQMNIADINLSPRAELHFKMQQQVEHGSSGLFNYRHRLKNGEIRDVEIYSTIIQHQSTYIYCIVHDITSRKQAERALCESQAKLHAIIETALDAVVQLDANGVIIDWNTQAECTFGLTRTEAIGTVLVDSIIPLQYHASFIEGLHHFVEGEEGAVRHSQFEIEAKHRSGNEFPIEVAITTLVGSDGRAEYCAFMRDIASRKKSEMALRKARTELENRVFERTAELVRSNRRLNSEIAERAQAQEALQESQEMLRQLVAHQDRIRENERKRIAREIHDELGQHLLVLRIDVSMLGRAENEHPKLGERIEAILQHIDATMKSVRAIINNLRPSVLDLGLYAALEWQAEEFQRRSGIACDLVAEDDDLELDDSVSTVLFRIVQEALTNVLRHAKASRVHIELKRRSGDLIMTIADNGVGMQLSQKSEQSSFGLVGIRERLHILGGELNVDSNQSGTTLTVTLPLGG